MHIGLVPTPDGGTAPLMLVDVLDVAEAIARVALHPDEKYEGQTVDVVGPSVMNARSFLEVVSAGARLQSTYSFPFPSFVLRRVAALLEKTMRRPLITQSQLHLFSTGVVGDVEQTSSLLGRAPRQLTEQRVRHILTAAPPEPMFGISFRPVWHPEHFANLDPYVKAARSLRWIVPLGLAIGMAGPFLLTKGQTAACLAAISAPAMLLKLPWLLFPGPLTLLYGVTGGGLVSFFCHKVPRNSVFSLPGMHRTPHTCSPNLLSLT
jgi:hypothetical protein